MKVLVVAKAPVAGRAKTRLGAEIGMAGAAEVAAAALLDTLRAAVDAVGVGSCHLSLDGDLTDATRGADLRDQVAGWTITPQLGDGFAARLARAHLDAGPGEVLQVGMDTPQLDAALLRATAERLEGHDAVLGPADDGGWWVLGRRDPDLGRALLDVEMSTPRTCADTRAALVDAGARVATAATLRDVDTVADARRVARDAPHSEFARTWARFEEAAR